VGISFLEMPEKKKREKKKLCKVTLGYSNFFGLFFTNIRCPPITLKEI